MTDYQKSLFDSGSDPPKKSKQESLPDVAAEPITADMTDHQKRVAEMLKKLGQEIKVAQKPTSHSKWKGMK